MTTEPTAIVPEPRCPILIRPATAEDMPFIDRLQKAHTHMAGFFPRQQMQKYLEAGEVLGTGRRRAAAARSRCPGRCR